MKVYYFLNNSSKENFNYLIEKLQLLDNGYDVHSIIQNFYRKVGFYIKDGIGDANFLEALSFVEFFTKKYNFTYTEALNKISFIHKENFFIYNEDIFILENDIASKIDTKSQKVYFVTSRDTFNSPFFILLNYLGDYNKNIKIIKYNNRTKEWPYIDKMYFISKIYSLRKKYIGDIIVPLLQNISLSSLKIFFYEASKLLGSEVILKKNFGDMGYGVRALKLNELCDDTIENIIHKFIPTTHGAFSGIYLTKYINIKNEYRVYYRYDDTLKEAFIYSVKRRVNNIGDDEVFKRSSFQIYENIPVSWIFEDVISFNKNKKYIDFIKKICKKVKNDCGVLEFFENEKGKLYFCEINSLGGSLMFQGEDENNMIKYYMDSLEMIF